MAWHQVPSLRTIHGGHRGKACVFQQQEGRILGSKGLHVCRSPVGSPLSRVDTPSQPAVSASSLPLLRSHLEGLDDTLEELCDLFTDRTAPIQLAMVTGPQGSGSGLSPLAFARVHITSERNTSKGWP